MKKKILALAVAGAMAGPMIAQANIYNIRTVPCHIELNDYRGKGKRKMRRQR